MKKVLLCFITLLLLCGCMQQNQEQKVTNEYYIIERANFNTVPWATVELIKGIGDKKLNQMKVEYNKGQFKSGKDFEKRMQGILTDDMIGKIGEKYDFQVVD